MEHSAQRIDANLTERVTTKTLVRQVSYFSETGVTHHLLNAVPSILIILNDQRQIVYGNRSLFELVGMELDLTYGQRPGELLRCVNARREPGGCGTAKACTVCGMLASILTVLEEGSGEERECRFLRQEGGRTEAIDLSVRATPLEHQGENFIIFALNDISHEKRRRALERIFFHDVLNVVGSIRGFTELLRDYDPPDRRDIYDSILEAAEQTISEIELQRTLTAAESGELKVRREPLQVSSFLQTLVDLYKHHGVARGKRLILDDPAPEIVVTTDKVLLGRIVGNMIKNALEASLEGEVVTVACTSGERELEFSVHNPAVIPRQYRFEIFQRSFSTKGPGRGLGTYSMKLLSEYLGGEVSFSSSEAAGTIFRATFPRATDCWSDLG